MDHKHRELYDLLEVDPSASGDEIKRAYKKAAMKYHPDRNREEGAEDKFKEIQAAFEVLKDDEKRQIYDQFGMEGLEKGMGGMGGGGMADIFSQLFRRQHERPTKSQDVMHAVGVGLEDLYTGKSQKLKITRRVVCTSCKGTGGKGGAALEKCKTCEGQGARIMLAQIAPGYAQRVRVPCDDCEGTGESTGGEKCEECHGHRVAEKEEEIELVVEKGLMHNQKIVIKGKANEEPGLEPGDLIFVVQEMEHETFKRKGDDLFVEHTLSLTEALCGFRFVLDTLDGRKLIVTSRPGEVIQPGEKKGIKNEGMPQNKNNVLRGTLYVQFNIVFPPSLSTEQITGLSQILPPAPVFDAPAGDHEEVHVTVPYREQAESAAYREDDDEPGGVQCQQS